MSKLFVLSSVFLTLSLGQAFAAPPINAHNFLPNGNESVWESECIMGMRAEMNFIAQGKVDISLSAYYKSNCEGRPFIVYQNSNTYQSYPEMKEINQATGEIVAYHFRSTYHFQRGPISDKRKGYLGEILGTSVQYFNGCVDKDAKETNLKTCRIHGLDKSNIIIQADRFQFMTPNSFLLQLDHKIKAIRFNLKQKR